MSIDVRATIWYCRWFSALSVLGLNEVMAWRASASVFFHWPLSLPGWQPPQKKRPKAWSGTGGLHWAAWIVLLLQSQPPPGCDHSGLALVCPRLLGWSNPLQCLHILWAMCSWHHFSTFLQLSRDSKWFKMISKWIEMVSKLDGKNVYKMYIITHPIAKHWLKHNALKCPEPLKQISNKIITKSNKNKVEQHYDYNMIILWFDNILLILWYIMNIYWIYWKCYEMLLNIYENIYKKI